MNANYETAAQTVRTEAAAQLAEAFDLYESAPKGDYRFRNSAGRMVKLNQDDARHPYRRAMAMRREALTLMKWTAQDEADYIRYTSDGIGATDGHYGQLTRSAWKATLGA